MLGYTSPQQVQIVSGKTFDSHQVQWCIKLIESAETLINARTGRRWIQTSSTVTELHMVYGNEIRLQKPPVASITSVTRRLLTVGYTAQELAANEWELLDAATGRLLLPVPWYDYPWTVTVTYVPQAIAAENLDPRVAVVTAKLVAYWMGSLTGDVGAVPADVQSYSVGGDLSVTFKQSGRKFGVPTDILAELDLLRVRKMAFA